MVRKIFKIGNSYAVSLPKETMQCLGLAEGSEVDITLNPEENVITIGFVYTFTLDCCTRRGTCSARC